MARDWRTDVLSYIIILRMATEFQWGMFRPRGFWAIIASTSDWTYYSFRSWDGMKWLNCRAGVKFGSTQVCLNNQIMIMISTFSVLWNDHKAYFHLSPVHCHLMLEAELSFGSTWEINTRETCLLKLNIAGLHGEHAQYSCGKNEYRMRWVWSIL